MSRNNLNRGERMTKTQWTKGFAKFLADYIDSEIEISPKAEMVRFIDKEMIEDAIESYEVKNNCTIVFVQLDENGVAKKGD